MGGWRRGGVAGTKGATGERVPAEARCQLQKGDQFVLPYSKRQLPMARPRPLLSPAGAVRWPQGLNMCFTIPYLPAPSTVSCAASGVNGKQSHSLSSSSLWSPEPKVQLLEGQKVTLLNSPGWKEWQWAPEWMERVPAPHSLSPALTLPPEQEWVSKEGKVPDRLLCNLMM